MKNGENHKPQLSREFIDYHALGMIRHLQKAGHTAYLVGGCVRDLLAGHMPKDFDIGTTALPQQVRKLVSHAFVIGKRFRLVLVKREDKQYEVATFRREPTEGEFPEGVPFGDNIFGTPEQDAFRRDFTCNALFYDPVAEKLIDYVDGQQDVENHIIRMIGDSKKRLIEDPIRILRALRFAHKLGFKIEPDLRNHMAEFADSLESSVLPRRREEYMKLLRLPDPARAFHEGFDLRMWNKILPELAKVYEKEDHIDLLEERLQRLESRLIDPSDTALLSGALLTGWLRATSKHSADQPITYHEIHQNSHLDHLKQQLGLHNWEYTKIIKALSIHKILNAPEDFKRRGQRRKNAVLYSEYFPLALDLAYIDACLDPDLLQFWDDQLSLAQEQNPPPRINRRKPHYKRRSRH